MSIISDEPAPKKQEHLLKGIEYYNNEDYPRALPLLQKATKDDPGNIDAWLYMGWTLASCQEYKEALDCYNQAAALFEASSTKDPKTRVSILASRGCALVQLGRFKEAIPILDETVALDPVWFQSWFDKGYAHIHVKDYKSALESFGKALENPESGDFDLDAWCYKGFLLSYRNQFVEATKCFEKALDLNPFSAGAWIGKELIQDKAILIQKQRELLEIAKGYLEDLLDDFRDGLDRVQTMFVIQFIVGIGLLIGAVAMNMAGSGGLLTLIIGGSGGFTILATLIFSAPMKLQKNRVDLSQWMIAYYNWINTLFAVNGLFADKAQNNEPVTWQEIRDAHTYLRELTTTTLESMERLCEFGEANEMIKAGEGK